MKKMIQSKVFVIWCTLLLTGCVIATYDYSATIECLGEPLAPQYNGGLIGNPDFNSGLDKWTTYGTGKVALRKSESGNNYMVAYDRKLASDSFSHSFDLQKDLLYTFSAWFQLDRGDEIVSAFLTQPDGEDTIVGTVIAKSDCWSMLKGGFTVEENMKAQLYFTSNNTSVEIWIDNVSLKTFTKTEWQIQQNASIDHIRKRIIKIQVTSEKGLKLHGINVTINQIRSQFPIGCGSTESIIHNEAYQDWFASRFTATTFDNEMKWYYTEKTRGNENYTVPDAMVSFFRKNGISIRGHNILWDSQTVIQDWVKILPPRELLSEAVRHVGSVVSRYRGHVIAWDIMNENMHNSFYEERIGANASSMFFQIARAMDPQTPLFLNEYNVLEHPLDANVIPSKYVEKIRETRSFPGNEDLELRIGLEGHFGPTPNISQIRAALDVLGATNIPIWLTELDTKRGPQQASELEDVMREAFSHPAVEGIIVWGGWKPTICSERCLEDQNYDVLPVGCSEMCLVDGDFKNLATGDVVDKLIGEWKTTNVSGVTDEDGVFEEKVFLGEYSLTYSHPPVTKMFNVTNDNEALHILVSL